MDRSQFPISVTGSVLPPPPLPALDQHQHPATLLATARQDTPRRISLASPPSLTIPRRCNTLPIPTINSSSSNTCSSRNRLNRTAHRTPVSPTSSMDTPGLQASDSPPLSPRLVSLPSLPKDTKARLHTSTPTDRSHRVPIPRVRAKQPSCPSSQPSMTPSPTLESSLTHSKIKSVDLRCYSARCRSG